MRISDWSSDVCSSDLLEGSGSRLVGPNSQGIMVPGRCKIGVMPAHLERPGKVGIVSRSDSLTSEVIEQISAQRPGQSASIGIRGAPVPGIGFVDCLKLFDRHIGWAGNGVVRRVGLGVRQTNKKKK